MSTELQALRTDSAQELDAALKASETRQYVTFIVGTEVFAVDMAPVQEIIRVPDVVRVPLAPRSLDGLANLRVTEAISEAAASGRTVEINP